MSAAALTLGVILTLRDQLTGPLNAARDNLTRVSQGLVRMGTLASGAGLAMGPLSSAAQGALTSLAADAMSAEHRLAALGNTANIGAPALAEIGDELRRAAQQTNQFGTELLSANEYLIAAGMEWRTALDLTPTIGRAATASQAAVLDLAKAGQAVVSNLGVPVTQAAQAFERLVVAGEAGAFELKDMAQYLPALTASMSNLGFRGVDAVSQLGAALQIARRGAGDSAEAANNLQNFLSKLTAPETLRNFGKQGVDLAAVLKQAQAEGLDPFKVALEQIRQVTGGDPFKLGELFGDMQVANFVKPMLEFGDDYAAIVAQVNASNGKLDANFGAMMQTSAERWKAFRIDLQDVGTELGNALLPVLSSLLEPLRQLGAAMSGFAAAHPGVTKAVLALLGIGAVLAPLLMVVGSLAVFGGALLRLAPVLGMALRGVQALGFAALLAGRSLQMGLAGGAVGGALTRLGAGLRAAMLAARGLALALVANPIGLAVMGIAAAALLIYQYWAPLKGFFVGLWQGLTAGLAPLGAQLRETFGPLAERVRGWLAPLGAILAPVGRWFAEAFGAVARLFPPIGQAVAGLVAWFRNLLTPVQDVGGAAEAMGQRFGTAIAGVIAKGAELVAAFARLPAELLRIGGDMIQGLINGIKAKWEALKASVSGIASGIAGTIKSALGIQSPSRVFAEIGGHLMSGLELGLQSRVGRVMGEVRGLAQGLAAVPLALAPIAAPALPAVPMPESPAATWAGEAPSWPSALAPWSGLPELAAPRLPDLTAPVIRAPELTAPRLPEARADARLTTPDWLTTPPQWLAGPLARTPRTPEAPDGSPSRLLTVLGEALRATATPLLALPRQLADTLKPRALATPAPPAAGTPTVASPRGGAPGAAPVIHFAPTINITGGAGDAGATKQAVQDAMQLSLRELERLSGELAHTRARRAYA